MTNDKWRFCKLCSGFYKLPSPNASFIKGTTVEGLEYNANRKLPIFFSSKERLQLRRLHRPTRDTCKHCNSLASCCCSSLLFLLWKNSHLMEFYLFTKFHESQNIEGKPCERWTTGVKITLETTGIVKKLLLWKCLFHLLLKTQW